MRTEQAEIGWTNQEEFGQVNFTSEIHKNKFAKSICGHSINQTTIKNHSA